MGFASGGLMFEVGFGGFLPPSPSCRLPPHSPLAVRSPEELSQQPRFLPQSVAGLGSARPGSARGERRERGARLCSAPASAWRAGAGAKPGRSGAFRGAAAGGSARQEPRGATGAGGGGGAAPVWRLTLPSPPPRRCPPPAPGADIKPGLHLSSAGRCRARRRGLGSARLRRARPCAAPASGLRLRPPAAPTS